MYKQMYIGQKLGNKQNSESNNMLYILTVYRDNSKRDITNIEDFVTHESLDNAIEYYNTYYEKRNLPYTIEETYDEKITNLDESNDDNVIDENVKYWVNVIDENVEYWVNVIDENVEYWVASDCEEWIEYYWSYKTLGEAKTHARECSSIEHCHVHINKSFKKVVMEK